MRETGLVQAARRGWSMAALLLICAAAPVATAAPAAVALPVAAVTAPATPADRALESGALELGRRIYREGLGADGNPLTAVQNTLTIRGKEAACMRCHRASGMGSVEGEQRVAPISGRYLFPRDDDMPMAEQDGHVGKTVSLRHVPYTLEAIERVMRQGVNNQNRALGTLMPRYQFSQAELQGLQAYLATLSVSYSPGAEAKLIHLATVITPDVSAERRQVFRDMLQAAVRSKNASTAPQRRYMAGAAMMMTHSDRRWALDIWELKGAPATWAAQLDALYAQNPPFAMLSGLAEGTWQPVHDFCDRKSLPCWFPSVADAPEADAQGYNLYFQRGVTLEADVLAAILAEDAKPGQAPAPRVVHQIRDNSPLAIRGAQALRQALAANGLDLTEQVLAKSDPEAVRRALQAAPKHQPVMLWVGEHALQGLQAAGDQPLYLSNALLGAQLTSIPPGLRSRARVIYPYAMPEERKANLAYLQTWLKLQQIPMVDEVMQSEVFFSVNFMTDMIGDMLDNLYRDYLIERAEDMLSKRESGKAEQETRDRQSLGRNARTAVERTARAQTTMREAGDMTTASQLVYAYKDSKGTTVYPRLSLGLMQRYASKGAAVVAFAPDGSGQLVLQHDWVIP